MIYGEKREVFLELAKRTGYEDDKTLQFLHHLMKNVHPSRVLELGTAFGASTAYMAAGIGNGLIVSIDNYSGAYSKKPDEVFKSLKILGLDKNVRLLHGNTHNSDILLEQTKIRKKFDILFMDADHSYKGLKLEYGSALSSLKKEHIIIVDDTHVSPEIGKFIVELAMEYAFCIMIKNMHWGMTVFCTNSGQMIKIADAMEEISND